MTDLMIAIFKILEDHQFEGSHIENYDALVEKLMVLENALTSSENQPNQFGVKIEQP